MAYSNEAYEKYVKPYRERNIEKVREANRESKKRTYPARRDTLLKNRYGVTAFDYDDLAKKQDNKCAICSLTPENKRMDLDHCHKTKQIRGLLCNNCNRGLGHFKDNPVLLNNAIAYLNKDRAASPDMGVRVEYDSVYKRTVDKEYESNWGSDWVDDGV